MGGLKQKGAIAMKFNILFLTLLLSSFAFNSSAFSESKVCANSLQAICDGEDAKNSHNEKEKYIRALKKEISSEATKNALRKIEEAKQKNKKPTRYEADIIIYKEIIKSAKSRMSGVETVVTNSSIIKYLKGFFKIAIDESSLNQANKHNFKRIIDSIIIGNFSDFLKRTDIGSDYIAQLGAACGLNGLAVNAFATILNGQRYVLVCPGLQITMHETPKIQDRINNILFVLAHEMGHHIDNSNNGINEKPYIPFLECMLVNYSNTLVKTKPIKEYCKTTGKDQCDLEVILSHAGELIADMWANKVVAVYARGQQYTVTQTDKFLMSAYGHVCGSTDEGIHPSGKFRIGIMLRLTPEISDYLSCNNSAVKKPACTLDGEVRL